MILKVVTLAAILAVIETRQGFSHGHGHLHGHGHAYSSQSIMMHQQDEEPIYYHHQKPYQNNERDHYQIHRVPVKTQGHRYQPVNQIREGHVRPVEPFNHPGIPFNFNDAKPHHGIPFDLNDAKPHHGIPFDLNDAKPHHGIPFDLNDAKPHHRIPLDLNDAKPHHGMPFNLNDARPQQVMPFSHHRVAMMNDHRNKQLNDHLAIHSVPKLQPHREYEFNYNIADIDTGDHKTHHETRNDGVVKGVYSFQEADGSIRIVEYTADEKNGFHANVRHEGLKHKVPKHRPQNHHPHHPRQHQHNRQNFHPLSFTDSYR